jgi:hypothetical protein
MLFYTPCQAGTSSKDLTKFEDLQLNAAGNGKVKVIIKLDVPQFDGLLSRTNKFLTAEPGQEKAWGGANADR